MATDDRFTGCFSSDADYPGSLDDVIQRDADLAVISQALAAGPVIDMSAVTFLPPLSRRRH